MNNKTKFKTWRMIYPDGTESLTSYDPIERAEKESKKWKKKLKEWHQLVVKGLVNGLSHTERDGRLKDIDFWRKRSILFNDFALCIQSLTTDQDYKYSEKNLKEIAKEGYKK